MEIAAPSCTCRRGRRDRARRTRRSTPFSRRSREAAGSARSAWSSRAPARTAPSAFARSSAPAASPSRRRRNPPNTTACHAPPSPPAWSICVLTPAANRRRSWRRLGVRGGSRRRDRTTLSNEPTGDRQRIFDLLQAGQRRRLPPLQAADDQAPPVPAHGAAPYDRRRPRTCSCCESDAEEARSLYQDLLIHVTRFFREPESFAALASSVPGHARGPPADQPIRVWVSGCATGEEAYSLAIALTRVPADGQHPTLRVQIFATDVSESGDRARPRRRLPGQHRGRRLADRLRRFFTAPTAAIASPR